MRMTLNLCSTFASVICLVFPVSIIQWLNSVRGIIAVLVMLFGVSQIEVFYMEIVGDVVIAIFV